MNTFTAVQAEFESRAQARSTVRSSSETMPTAFDGLLFCGPCRAPLRGQRQGSALYYQCPAVKGRSKSRRGRTCEARLSEETVRQALDSWLARKLAEEGRTCRK
ncbi:MAG TPA: zinc ribbon domain-containing protein [Actinocatenispora sp.]